MTNSTNLPILDDDAVREIAEMFPHTEYQPTLSPDEVDPCEFCKGTIDDHKANCVVPHVHALCQTVRALRTKHEWLRSKIAWHRDGAGPDVPVLQERYDKLIAQRNDLRSQLEQVTRERDDMRQRILELETEIDTKRRYL